MSYSRRQLYAMGEPLGDSATYRKADGGLVLGGGGNSSTPTNTTVSSTELPAWAQGYAKDTLANAANLTDINKNPYKTYDQPRIAGFSPMQEQAQSAASNMSAGPEAFQQNMSSYMSPYMQNVVDVQKREAARQSGIMGTQQQAQAAQAGAFGGSRDAIMRSERERNLGQQMNQIQAQGSQAAYDSAANQFRQGITQDVAINQLQNQYGGQQQQLAQQGLNTNYQDFLNQQNYPYKQIGFMSDLVRGLPLGQQSTQSMYQAPPSMMQSVGALGLGAYGVGQLMGKAEGGQVKSYAAGGDVNSMDDPNAMTAAVSKLSDEQLQQIVQHPSSAAELQAAKLELATRASEKGGLAGAYNMAHGGMVAFAHGGIPRYDGEEGSLVSGDDDTGGADAQDAQDAQDDQTQGGSLSDAALHAQAVRTGLSSLRNAQNRALPEPIDANDPNSGLSASMATMRKLAGPDPYPEIKGKIAGMAVQSQQALEQGKGLAALHAMGALLQGPDFMRALGGSGVAFADSYGQAMQANRAAQQAQLQMSINVAAGQRAENLGLAKDAMGSFQAANANKIAVYKATNERDRNLATAAARLASATRAPKPVAPVKPSTQEQGVAIYAADAKAKNPKLTDVQANAIGLRQYNTEKAAGLAGPALTAAASNQRAAQSDALTLTQQDSAAREKASTAASADLLMNKDYREAKRTKDTATAQRIENETFTKHYNRFRPSGSAPPPPLNLNAPKAAPTRAAAPTTRLKFDANGQLIQ